MRLDQFYRKAKEYCIRQGYQKEIDLVENRKFEDVDSKHFFWEYTFVVFNTGMKNQVAESMYRKFASEGIGAVKHPGKKKAIKRAMKEYPKWFRCLKYFDTVDGKLDYLESLPFIGKVNRYHLARNLGIDVAKPDRHLVRMAEIFGYPDVQEMCDEVSKNTGDRIGTVDLVLWRYSNLSPKWHETLGNKSMSR